MPGYRIVRDARGSLVHVRTSEGECVGCIEVGLYEIVRMVIAEETANAVEGSPTLTASAQSVDRGGRAMIGSAIVDHAAVKTASAVRDDAAVLSDRRIAEQDRRPRLSVDQALAKQLLVGRAPASHLLKTGAAKELGWLSPQDGYALFESDSKESVLGMVQGFFPYYTQSVQEVVPWEKGKQAILDSARQAATR